MATIKAAKTPQRTGVVEIRAVRNGYLVRPSDTEPGRYYPSESFFVFPDFPSLTAWLRKNLTHGGGVE